MDNKAAIETLLSFEEGPVYKETECRDKSYEQNFIHFYLTCDEYIKACSIWTMFSLSAVTYKRAC